MLRKPSLTWRLLRASQNGLIRKAGIRSYYSLSESPNASNIRNIAVVAHVDHGKTTLVDQMLKLSGRLSAEAAAENARVLDSNDLERERGITILSKCTSIQYRGHKINILDTPGHADFGGEVERILNMVDSVVLLVDVSEGPKPQTKFVLSKALNKGLTPIVVLNKIDRPGAEDLVEDAQMDLMELFETLGAKPHQIEKSFENVLFSSALQGWATKDLSTSRASLEPLLDTIVSNTPAPSICENTDAKSVQPFRMLISMISYDKQWGRIVTGKVCEGEIKPGMEVKCLGLDGNVTGKFTAKQVLFYHGMEKEKMQTARSGDIISIVGSGDFGTVTDTLCSVNATEPLPTDPIEPAVLKFTMTHNDSPLHGKDGKKYQKADLEKRLMEEVKSNVSIEVEKLEDGDFSIGVRGELQLAILLESMRREGYEFQIGAPRIVYQKDKDTGKLLEPIENLKMIDIPPKAANELVDDLSQRYGVCQVFQEGDDVARVEMEIPSRALIGFEADFRMKTRGIGAMTRELEGYCEYKGAMKSTRMGALVNINPGKATSYACHSAQTKGGGCKYLLIEPGDEIYEGQIVGEFKMPHEKTLSLCRGSPGSGHVGSVASLDYFTVQPRKYLSIEEACSWIEFDELVEITPKHIRFRKVELNTQLRAKNSKKRKIEYG